VCTTTAAAGFELDRSIETPGRARVIVGMHLCPVHGTDALPAAQLLVTELATCAVLYGSTPLRLELDCEVSHLRITVTHGVPAGWAAEDLPIDEDGGLRSALLDKLARSWGAEAVDGAGRRLWCRLPTGHVPDAGPGPKLSMRNGRGSPS
jgi:hypothetical protein